jgi:catechol 2,3-dioxygenase-like lactoylglutathione lyase family enzyme
MSAAVDFEIITLFVEDLEATRHFYRTVFEPKLIYEDDVSCVLAFGGVMINLLRSSQAPGLVSPAKVAPASAGASMLLTLQVPDVDAVCAGLQGRGVTLLNGPQDRPWGRRTAAFADPAGHVWEVAQVLN